MGESSGQGLLWVSQHCRWGLKLVLAQLHPQLFSTSQSPGMEMEQAQAPHYSTAGPARGTWGPQAPKLAAKLRGYRKLGVSKASCFSSSHNWNHPARAQRLCWVQWGHW